MTAKTNAPPGGRAANGVAKFLQWHPEWTIVISLIGAFVLIRPGSEQQLFFAAALTERATDMLLRGISGRFRASDVYAYSLTVSEYPPLAALGIELQRFDLQSEYSDP